MTIEQLYPLPGAKASTKYDRTLYAPLDCHTIAEPFMGASCRGLLNCDRLSVSLGEINPAQRAIALALHNPQAYVDGYHEALNRFWDRLEDTQSHVLSYAGRKEAQKALGQRSPDVCEGLTENWRSICSDIYQWMQTGKHPKLAGYYAFAIRACFGNVMRLTPAGTHFNVSWHVDKLNQACVYNPQQWIDELAAMRWNPTVLNSWQECIEAVPNPEKTYLLLDPPYTCDHESETMSPCYTAHAIGTKDRNNETLQMAVDSFQAGLERGFPTISVCNYFVPELDAAIRQLAADAGYSIQHKLMGECNALGNSNGRRKHGQRVDGRARPIEVIYRVERVPSKFFAVAEPKTVKQLPLV